MKPNRVTLGKSAGRPNVKIHVPDSRAHWRRFGTGVANVEVTFDRDSVNFDCEETAFAGHGDKRDVSKRTMIDVDREAARAIHKALGDWLFGDRVPRFYLQAVLRPGMYAGEQGERTREEWIADAIDSLNAGPFPTRSIPESSE